MKPAKEPVGPAWFKCETRYAEAVAIRTLYEGKPLSPDQSRIFVEWLFEDACRIGDATFIESSPRGSDFLQGRQHPAREFMKAVKLSPQALERMKQAEKGG